MDPLALVTLATALACAALFLPAALKPDTFHTWAEAYPRSAWPGRILLLIAMPWAAYVLVQDPPFAGNALLIKLVVGIAPVAIVLILVYLNELLSARVLGGLLLLAAHPVLATARWHPSDWTLVMQLLAYVWVIAGMVLVVSPFRLRLVLKRWTSDPKRCSLVGWVGVVFSAVLAVLALVVYR